MHARSGSGAQVMLVCLDDDPTRPGAPVGVARLLPLVGALAGQGTRVSVVTRPTDGSPRELRTVTGGVQLDRLPGESGPAGSFPHLRRALPSFVDGLVRAWAGRDDVVVLAHGWASAVASRAALARLRSDASILMLVDEPVSAGGHPTGPALARLETAAAAGSDAVLVANQEAADLLVWRGVARRKVHALPHPLLAPEDPPLAPMSRPAPARGPVAVLASMPGPPSPDDPAVRRGLQVAHAATDGDVCTVPAPPARDWAAFWADSGPVVGSAAVVLHLPDSAPTGHELLAVMSRGAAVVASAVGAHRDVIEDRVSGRLVAPADVVEAVRCVRDLLEHPFTADAYGAAAQDRVLTRHGFARAAAELALAIERVSPPRQPDTGMSRWGSDGDDGVVDLTEGTARGTSFLGEADRRPGFDTASAG